MDKTKSYFDGKLIEKVAWEILGVLITIVTIGICFPWAICMIENWETKHTVIEGKRLTFDGKAIQLFGNWIKWLFLGIITLGIYFLWADIKMKQWVTKHTHFVN